MPTKDRSYEYVRIRPRKDRDKDRDADTQSNSGNSVTTIRERKHRKSFVNQSCSAETSTQGSTPCRDDSLDQLPSLSETEESEYASASTSPIARIQPNVSDPSNLSTLPSIETPAMLQPYLEESEDSMSTVLAPYRVAESQEWIGPLVDAEPSNVGPLDSLTPTPGPKQNPLECLGGATKSEETVKSPGQSPITAEHVGPHRTDNASLGSNMIYSWGANDDHRDQCYYPPQMPNPFLSPEHHLSIHTKPLTMSEAKQSQPAGPAPPLEVSAPPSPLQGRARAQAGKLPRDKGKDTPQIVSVEHMPVPTHNPPTLDTTIRPGMLIPIPPALSPVPMHHVQPHTFAVPSVPARMDHPANILHRVSNVLPDITALMDMYHSTCNMLHARDQHICDLEAQKATESDRLNKRIDGLASDIESIIRHRETQEKKLRDEIHLWEVRYGKMQESYSKERRQKEEAVLAHLALKDAYEDSKKKHEEAVESMSKAFLQEKERLVAVHNGEKQSLIDQLDHSKRTTEETLASLERRNGMDRQVQESQWQRHVRDIRDDHAKALHNLDNDAVATRKVLEEERSEHIKTKNNWIKEREAMTSQWGEERASSRRTASDQLRTLSNQHRKELDDLQSKMDSTLAQQEADTNEKVSKYIRDKEEIQSRLDQTLTRQKYETPPVGDALRKEKDEYKEAEAAFACQAAEFQTRIRDLQKDRDALVRPREASVSRHLREAQETIIRLKKENEDLLRSRGPSQSRSAIEAKELLSKLQKENETLRADKARLCKPKAEEAIPSRSSTPAPKGEPLERTRSHRASGIFGSSTSSKGRSAASQEAQNHREEGYRSHQRDRAS